MTVDVLLTWLMIFGYLLVAGASGAYFYVVVFCSSNDMMPLPIVAAAIWPLTLPAAVGCHLAVALLRRLGY